MKGLEPGQLVKELSNAYGPDAYTPPSIKYWIHQIKLRRTDLRPQHTGGRLPLDDINTEILLFLGKYPFSSVWMYVESLEIPASTMYSHLVEKNNLNIFYFAGFPMH
jgi:hypothetical protein